MEQFLQQLQEELPITHTHGAIIIIFQQYQAYAQGDMT